MFLNPVSALADFAGEHAKSGNRFYLWCTRADHARAAVGRQHHGVENMLELSDRLADRSALICSNPACSVLCFAGRKVASGSKGVTGASRAAANAWLAGFGHRVVA